MDKTKIFRAISGLSRTELNRLLKYVSGESPQHASNLVILLAEDCKSKNKIGEKSDYWKEMYDKAPYHDLRFRKICSDGVQLIERFLSIEYYFSDPLQEATTRLLALSRDGMESLYNAQLSRTQNLVSRSHDRGASHYYQKYLIEQQKYRMTRANLQRFEVTNIDQILHNLDVFYFVEKLRYYCEILSRRTFLKHDYQNRLITEILSLVENEDLHDVPAISVYRQIVLTHLYPDDHEYYFTLKETIAKNSSFLPIEHRKEVFDALLNYCNRKINTGHANFLAESFDHYQSMLKEELIFVDGLITHWTFKNVVVLALRLGEYDWAERFIEQFSDRIQSDFRTNAIKYNLAQLHFYRQNFAEVLTLLQEVEYEDVSYNLGAKTMLLATYYELDEHEALRALGDSFRVFLNRRKHTIPEGRRKSYLNLISFANRLISIDRQNHNALKKLQKKMDAAGAIASEFWIREKLANKMQLRQIV